MHAPDFQVAYLLASLVTLFALVAMGAFATRRRGGAGAAAVAAACASAAAWNASILLMALSPPGQAAFWLSVKYGFIAFTPVSFAWFVLDFTGRLPEGRAARGLLLAVLCAIPLVTQAVIWTDADRGWMIASIAFDRVGLLTFASRIEFGPYYWVATGWSYLLVIGSIVLAATWTLRAGPMQRAQGWAIAVGLAAPLAANVALLTRLVPPRFDPMPFGLAIGAAFFGWAIFGTRMLDFAPIARGVAFDAIDEALLATDPQGRVIDLNRSMARLLGVAPRDAVGRPAMGLLARAPSLASRFSEGGDGSGDPVVVGERAFAVRMVPLAARSAGPQGRLLVLHDLSARIATERQRDRLIDDLRDALAQVRTLRGLLPLCAACKNVRDGDGRWLPVDAYIRDHSEATVSHGICPDCTARLYPSAYRAMTD
ncbi:MAG: histidine kinase N-terminal 7TM domain-containing protein [Lautropia sp.]